MDVTLYRRLSGEKKIMEGLTPAEADRVFNAHKPFLSLPFTNTYRVTLTDKLRAGYIIRDTDREVFGIGGTTETPGNHT